MDMSHKQRKKTTRGVARAGEKFEPCHVSVLPSGFFPGHNAFALTDDKPMQAPRNTAKKGKIRLARPQSA
jgi:hypothetical protein